MSNAAYILEAQQPTGGPADPPLPTVTVELQFTDNFCGKPTEVWTDTQKNTLRTAADFFQKVWSSAEFRTKVQAIASLIYQDDNISGIDLYTKLTAQPAKLMKLSVNNKHKECARTDAGYGETLIHRDYLNSSQTTVADLVNTLSHECTHYTESGESWDQGNSGNWGAYVSYGVGCMTQNLSGSGATCDYDPSHPMIAMKARVREFPEHAPGGAWRGKKKK